MTVHRGVRYRADVGWELRCDSCAADKGVRYWPLDLEFWRPDKGLSRCKACWNEYERKARRAGRRPRRRSANLRRYQREWSARKRQQQREAEGRELYERRAA